MTSDSTIDMGAIEEEESYLFNMTENDTITDYYAPLTSPQDAFLSIAPRISAGLSILGCAWIVLEVWYYSNKRYYVYHKLISAMAMYCILTSIWYFVSDWAYNNSDQDREGICRTQGFFIQLSLAPMIYFSMLFLYYLLVISYSLPEQKLTYNYHSNHQHHSNTNDKPIPWWHRMRLNWDQIFHIVPVIGSIVTAIICLPLDLYHPMGYNKWCWVAPSLEELEEYQDLQGVNRVSAFQWGFFLAPSWISFIIMVTTLYSVFRGVQGQEERMKKYITTRTANVSSHGSVISSVSKEISSRTNSNHHSNFTNSTVTSQADISQGMNQSKTLENFNQGRIHVVVPSENGKKKNENQVFESKLSEADSLQSRPHLLSQLYQRFNHIKEFWEHRPRTRQVVGQCGCYVAAFFWSTIFLTINQSIYWESSRQRFGGNGGSLDYIKIPYALLVLQAICQPLLGFFIFLTYRRPFYLRVRRQGLTRQQALKSSVAWNQNPVDPPRRYMGRSSRFSRTTIRLPGSLTMSSQEKEERRRSKQEKRMRQQALSEERNEKRRVSGPLDSERIRPTSGPIYSEPSTLLRRSFLQKLGIKNLESNTLDSAGYHNGTKGGRLETLEEVFYKSASTPLDFNRSRSEQLDAGRRKFYAEEDPEMTQSYTESTLESNQKAGGDGHDSFSTFATRRTSTLSKDGSSRKFQNEESIHFNELMHEPSEENDDDSVSFEELLGGETANPEEDLSSDGGEINEIIEDVNANEVHQQQNENDGSSVGERSIQEDFRMIKQYSDRYKDLVSMDIIPEADGFYEETWRSIEARVGRYKKTKHDKHKMNMSVPVMSERNLPDLPLPLPTTEHRSSSKKTDSSLKGPKTPRFAWSNLKANPLYKISGRLASDSQDPNNRSRAPPSAASSGTSDSKKSVARTTSGGYFSESVKENPDTSFWAKLELEKARKEILKAISSRRFSDSTPEQDSSKDIDSTENIHDSTQNTEGYIIPAAVANARRSSEEPQNLKQSLDNIPEGSEHSEIAHMLHDIAPKYVQKRISDGSDIAESSNEFTIRSTGSSIRTLKRSNRHKTDGRRSSNVSGYSSEDVSLVSDTPMSDDDFLSESDSDSSDIESESAAKEHVAKLAAVEERRPPRYSAEGLQRVSERSMEYFAHSSGSGHSVDTDEKT